MGKIKNDEELLLKALYADPKVFWQIGGEGTSIRLVSELERKLDLFSWVVYEGEKENPTMRYMREVDLNETFAGENPDMVPDSVRIIDGGVIEINFKRSERLKKAGVDGSFILDRTIVGLSFGVMVKGYGSDKYVIGYETNRKPVVKFVSEEGVVGQMTFNIP